MSQRDQWIDDQKAQGWPEHRQDLRDCPCIACTRNRRSERGERNEALVVWTPERLEQFRSAPPCEKHFSPSWHDDKRLDHWVDCDGCLREAFHAGTVAAEWGSHRIEKLRKAARLIANLDSTLALTVGAAADYFASSPLLRGAPVEVTEEMVDVADNEYDVMRNLQHSRRTAMRAALTAALASRGAPEHEA